MKTKEAVRDRRTDGQRVRQTDGKIDRQTDGWADERTDERTNGLTGNGWTDEREGQTDLRRTNRWMDGGRDG
jgi:hypothetical protein